MENLDDFGKRLRALREERDLSLDMVVYDIDQKYTIELTVI